MSRFIILLKFKNEEDRKFCEGKLKKYLSKFIKHLKIESFEIHDPIKEKNKINKIIEL